MDKIRKLPLSLTPLALGLVLLSNSAWALYKVVGPDGKVSYTDRPPVASSDQITNIRATGARSTAEPSSSPLPLALREVASKFPVVFYVAASNCEPCNSARQLLQQRGIPFTERTASTNEDIEALERRTGSKDVPALTIGSQVLRGFSSAEWTQYLDTAGYPATSALPPGYKAAAATPLTTPPTTVVAPAAREVPLAPPAPPLKTPPSAPGGIRF